MQECRAGRGVRKFLVRQAGSRMRWLTGWALGSVLLVSCSPAAEPTPVPSTDTATLSQRALDLAVFDPNGPGCGAAVGEQGVVVWQGARGVADLDSGTPITESTVFDIGSVTKQFTATMILLLAADGKLALDDRVSEHLNGLPDWAKRVSISDLIHHASGIPDFFGLLLAEGHTLDTPTGRDLAFRVIAGVRQLDFKPGTRFEYSNSNYLLLGHLIEGVTQNRLADVLANRIFRPLGLDLVMAPIETVPGKARSYRFGDDTRYRVADWHWDAAGAAGIQARLADLVQWADNYRTGTVGGQDLLHAQLKDAVDSGDGSRYGAGILTVPDGSLTHDGEYGGFHTLFYVSPDRTREIAVACNLAEINVSEIGQKLAELWPT